MHRHIWTEGRGSMPPVFGLEKVLFARLRRATIDSRYSIWMLTQVAHIVSYCVVNDCRRRRKKVHGTIGPTFQIEGALAVTSAILLFVLGIGGPIPQFLLFSSVKSTASIWIHSLSLHTGCMYVGTRFKIFCALVKCDIFYFPEIDKKSLRLRCIFLQHSAVDFRPGSAWFGPFLDVPVRLCDGY